MALVFGAINNGWQVLGSADGAGGGDSITVNATAVVDADFDDTTPAAPASATNVKWQKDTSSPANISAYIPWQMSVTADGSGLKLDGDAASPGASMLYGTNASSVKGWYAQPGGGTGVTRSTKTGNQSFTVTSLADVTDMTFSIDANATASFSFWMPFTTAATTTGLVLGLNGPGTPARLLYTVCIATSATTNFYSGATAYNQRGVGTGSAGVNSYLPAYMEGTLVNGATSGTVQLRAASEINASAATIFAGAWCWKV